MEILSEIAIYLKDRVLLLDKDLCERQIDISKHSEWCSRFHCWKGRHYKNLKQGPGWSFPLASFPSSGGREATAAQDEEVAPLPPVPPVAGIPEKTKTPEDQKPQGHYDIDIPDEVRQYFRYYEEAIFFQEQRDQ